MRNPTIVVAPPASVPHLLDANLLLRVAQKSHPMYETARDAVLVLNAGVNSLVTVPQSLYEFWTVATRPSAARDGLGLSPVAAHAFLGLFEQLYPPLPESPLYVEWRRLVTTYGVSGKAAHDARLVAAMKVHGLTHILTFNGADFTRYSHGEGIVIVDPAAVASPSRTP